MSSSAPLPREFYSRPTAEVARDLLGKILVHGRRRGRIVETEAYLGLEDDAAHASRGRTPRTEVLFGPPGHAYVYLIYGIHDCFNIVAEPEGIPGCVLIRAVAPVRGIAQRADGPGRLTKAMGIRRSHNGTDLTCGSLTIHETPVPEPFTVKTGPRVGIKKCTEWPLRFLLVPGVP